MHWKPIANLYKMSQNRLTVLEGHYFQCMHFDILYVFSLICVFCHLDFSFFFRCDEIVQGEI